MRALLLLSVVMLSFVLVRWLKPARAESGASSRATEASVQFLSLDRRVAPVPQAQPGAVQQAEPGVPAKGPPVAPSGGEEVELQVAAALVHGTPADVQAAAAALSPSRARLAEAFAWAMAGERQLAVSLSSKIAKEEVPGRESMLLEAALSGRALLPASTGEGSLPLAMEMLLQAREGHASLASGQDAAAARLFSSLLQSEIDAPWPPDSRVLEEWTGGLDRAQLGHRWSPRGEWPGVEMTVESGDSLISIRKRFLTQRPGALMCTGLIERANGVKGFLQPGQVLRVPTDEAHVLVDLQTCWALYFLGDEVAGAWQVGTGRPGEETPPGDYTVCDKIENPPWMKVGQETIPFGDPRNPLGTRWMGWALGGRKTSYGFHGTTDPKSIGSAESDGCVRFHNRDIEVLFSILPEGAPIRVQR